MQKFLAIPALAIFFMLPVLLSGQDTDKNRLLQARMLLNDYRDASSFEDPNRGGFDPSLEIIFRNSFRAGKIIFDVPLRTSPSNGIAMPSENGSAESITKIFGEYVTIGQYIDSIRKAYDWFGIREFNYGFFEKGYDTSMLSSQNKIVFEIEKRFANTYWSVQDSRSYLFEISFFDGTPKITSIRPKFENFAKNDVVVYLVDTLTKRKDHREKLADIVTRFKIDFEENIDDRLITDKSDSAGRINLGMIAGRASLILDSVYSLSGIRYSTPSEWSSTGKKVSQQPVGGFRIQLNPYRWNGISWSMHVMGGSISQSNINMQNFEGGSSFAGQSGLKTGAGADIAYFVNPSAWSAGRNNWIFGAGTGIAVHYLHMRITADQFSQKPYAFPDRTGDTALILYSGKNFEETLSSFILSVPVFLETRKKFSGNFINLSAASLRAGINFMVPLQSSFTADGSFSRYGRYPEYGNQVITGDEFYNYYSGRPESYDDDVDYKTVMAEGTVMLSGFFDLFSQDNALQAGLVFSFPITDSNPLNPQEYLISSGGGEPQSIMYSKTKIYRYFFGLRLGVSFIRYKVN